jgi:hypothetical protein
LKLDESFIVLNFKEFFHNVSYCLVFKGMFERCQNIFGFARMDNLYNI